jgi:formylmethanofuran dehydrogenase subunit C
MSALTFKLRAEPDQRLDLSALTPDRLAGLSAREINALTINTTKSVVNVGDIFRLTMGDPSNIRIVGGSGRFDRVGESMAGGNILVEGDVGARVCRGMQGGTVLVKGNAGPWAGTGMSGGSLTIKGNVGDWLGGPLPGEMAGMRGGTVLVEGRAGKEAGHRMRRGIIVVARSAGAYAGRSMIAGSLIICSDVGIRPGMMMRRGTLVLGRPGDSLLPTFSACGPVELVFTEMLRAFLAEWAPMAARILARPLKRFAGDHAVGGKAEILTPV